MKKSFVYALSAIVYIVFIVTAIWSTESLVPAEDTILIPIAMLGLLVLSVALMGFLFFYEPFCLYLDGHKKEAVAFFGKTVGFFAGFVVLILLSVLIF